MTTAMRRISRTTTIKGRLGALLLLLAVLSSGSGVAGPLYWDMPAGRPFADCNLEGMKITADGALAPGLLRGSAWDLDVDLAWVMVPDGKGGYYLGTGHEGLIVRLDGKDNLETVADLDCDQVLSLAVLPDGRLVAGCEPDGQVLLVSAAGQATVLGKVPEKYVWDMTVGPQGKVYLAVGSPAALLVADPDQGGLDQVTDFPAENALAVAFGADGKLLVATQGPGLVYRLDPQAPRAKEVVLQTDQNEVNDLLAGPDGLCALALDDGTGEGQDQQPPSGDQAKAGPQRPVVMLPGVRTSGGTDVPHAALYQLEGMPAPTLIWSGDLDLMSALYVPDVGWIGGGLLDKEHPLAVLNKLTPPAGEQTLASWRGGDIMTLLPGRGPGRIMVVQTRPSRIDVFGPGGKGQRLVTGPVLDAGRAVDWGRLSWTGAAPGQEPAWSVRTGNRETADGTWSEWSRPMHGPDMKLDVPPSRFLQWRLSLPSSAGEDFTVASVTVSAWGKNRPPVISALNQENLKNVRKGGLMEPRSHLTRTFGSGLKAEFSRRAPAARPGYDERVKLGRSVKVFSWKATDPDGDRLDYELACRREGQSEWVGIASGRDGGLEAWDSSQVPDGSYRIRLTVRDDPDNPGDQALSGSRVLGPVVVDNTPPRIRDLQATARGRIIHIEFEARDEGSPLAGAFLVLADQSRERLDPRDRICDSVRESFSCDHALAASDTLAGWVRIEVLDAAGNVATGKCPVVPRR